MLKDIFKIASSKVIRSFLAVLQGIIVSKFLGPSLFGIGNFIQIIRTFCGFSGLGIDANYSRKVPYYLKKDPREAEAIKGNVTSLYLSLNILVSIGLIFYAAFFLNKNIEYYSIIKIGIILLSISLLLNRLHALYQLDAASNKDFDTIYKADIFVGFLILGFIAITIYYLGIFSVFIAPIIGSFVYIYRYRKKYSLSFKYNPKYLKPFFSYGLPFFFLNIAYWGMRLTDKIVITNFLSFRELGLYSLGANIAMQLQLGLGSFSTVLLPNFQQKLGSLKNYREIAPYIKKYSPLLNIIIAFIFGNFLFFINIIPLVLPKYIESLIVMRILTMVMIVYSMTVLQNLLLTSNVLNKTMHCVGFYFFGIVINSSASYFLILKGYGINGVAWATAGSAVMVQLMLLFYSHRFYLANRALNFYAQFFRPFLIMAISIFAALFVVRENVSILLSSFLRALVFSLTYFLVFSIFNNKSLKEIYNLVKAGK